MWSWGRSQHFPERDAVGDTEMDGSTGSRSYVGGRDVKGNKGRVLVDPGISEEFSMNICLKQGSALIPLMFIMVMELESRKVSLGGSMGRELYIICIIWHYL